MILCKKFSPLYPCQMENLLNLLCLNHTEPVCSKSSCCYCSTGCSFSIAEMTVQWCIFLLTNWFGVLPTPIRWVGREKMKRGILFLLKYSAGVCRNQRWVFRQGNNNKNNQIYMAPNMTINLKYVLKCVLGYCDYLTFKGFDWNTADENKLAAHMVDTQCGIFSF